MISDFDNQDPILLLNEVEISDKTESYSSGDHSSKLLEKMDEMRGDDFDIQIVVQGEVINAHKIILKASSKYFLGLFNSGMKESVDDKIVIEEFDFATMTSLINFVYTSKLEVTSDNVFALYQASDLYEIEAARNFCSSFLISSLTNRNCFELLFAARLYTNKRLMNEIIKFISCHVEFITKAEAFLQLSFDDIDQLISSSSFMFASEAEIFKCIISWINHNQDERKDHLFHMFKTLRLNHLPPKFLIQHVRSNELVSADKDCLRLIMDTYENIILPNPIHNQDFIKRTEVCPCDVTASEPEDIEPGPNVKVFDQMVSLLGLEFHVNPGTIERLSRAPHAVPHGHGPRGGFFKWDLAVFNWCDYSKAWELIVKTAIAIPMPNGSNVIPKSQKLPFSKRLMTKHMKIHINHVPPQSFKVTYHLPKIMKNLNQINGNSSSES